ncbi:MAG: hypothetical protein BRC29_03595 [Nanohaloarchaea archaeon SW_7_43_1]|nr:MAG: hypothetical protein BRC29_03595 [Nanohaloarchaea archaeon SW_7_43_1]
MISKHQQQKFSESANLESGKIVVKPEFSISHDPDVDEEWIESKIDTWTGKINANPDVLYIPGTFNEESNGYFHTTMPVIADGEVLNNRKKVKSNYEVHNWTEAARQLDLKDEFWLISEAERTLGSPSKSYMIPSNAREVDSILYKGPKNTVSDEVHEVATEEALETIDTVEFNGYEVLPVICNELSRIELEDGMKPDIIVEASYDLPAWEDDYREFSEKNNIDSTYILRADGVYPEESGVYQLESGLISEADL